MNDENLSMRLQLTAEQRARKNFLVNLKRLANLSVPAELRKYTATQVEPRISRELHRELSRTNREDRKLVKEAVTPHPLYKAWEVLTYASQDMMWSLAAEVIDDELPRIEKAKAHHIGKTTAGSLKLDPDLKVPSYIAGHEIHRQPGGFAMDAGEGDIAAGLFYMGAGMIYGPGKNQGNPEGYGAGHFVLGELERRYPGFKPKRILDVGCGTGRGTLAYAHQFPEAELFAIDCAPAFLRYGHALAESEGATIHFRQMDAEHMDFEDESFDLIVSHIVGHETTPKALPRMIAECWRLVRPGGVIFHMDVPTQISRMTLVDQVMNDWQVKHNGEHFWTGWAEADLAALMKEAGYPEDTSFAEHVQRAENGPVWFVHGAQKKAG